MITQFKYTTPVRFWCSVYKIKLLCGRRNDIITILSNREYMDGLYNKLLFIKALQREEDKDRITFGFAT